MILEKKIIIIIVVTQNFDLLKVMNSKNNRHEFQIEISHTPWLSVEMFMP